MKDLKLLIFDFDGTILDTETPALKSWENIYAGYNLSFPCDDFARRLGGDWKNLDCFENIENAGFKIDRESVHNERKLIERRLISETKACNELLRFCQESRDAGLKLAVASSSPGYWVKGHLDRLQISNLFDLVGCIDDDVAFDGKPCVYRSVTRTLNTPSELSFAFEDSLNGVRAAKSTGCFVAWVPNSVTVRIGDIPEADLRLDGFKELTPAIMIEKHQLLTTKQG